jgi:hypothetical protein
LTCRFDAMAQFTCLSGGWKAGRLKLEILQLKFP